MKIDKEGIIKLIDIAVLEVEKYIKKYNLSTEHQLETHTLKVLKLLKQELVSSKEIINERLLRGYKDICTTTAIQYEESNFNDAIFMVNKKLEESIDGYKYLPLLRMDFGKGNPI
jgi:Tfp pilus assembly major pilin PilA